MLKPVDVATKNRLRVAEYLTTLDPREFHMNYCTHCIAGIINRRFLGRHDLRSDNWNETRDAAAAFLDIDDKQAELLFEPGRAVCSKYYTPEPEQGARVMRHLAATDEVDWSVTGRR
jgi:hypothetical protein